MIRKDVLKFSCGPTSLTTLSSVASDIPNACWAIKWVSPEVTAELMITYLLPCGLNNITQVIFCFKHLERSYKF